MPRLTEQEQQEIIRFLEADKPLPDKYRFLLFEDKREVELVWNGKTNEVCNIVLPFQSIELVDEPRAEKPDETNLQLGLFDERGRQRKGWTNKLIWGDNKLILSSLKNGPLREEIEEKGGLKRNVVLQNYDNEYIDEYYRYTDEDGRCFMSADLSGAGPGPPRHFGNRGEISPPSGRHWMYNQAGIDKALSENKIYWTRNGVPRLKKFLDESDGMPASDIWDDIQPLRSWHKDETTGYSTQKPEALLERVIKASSNEGDLVADFFCGSRHHCCRC